MPFVSYFYSHRDDRRRRNPAKRAAALTTAALEFKKQVDTNALEPEYMRGQPMAMSSYWWMFNACRIPARPYCYPVKHSYQENPYIIVIRKNQFFKVMHEVGGTQLNTSELEQQFRRVYEKADKSPAIGIMTTERRGEWTKVSPPSFMSRRNRIQADELTTTQMRENLITANPTNKLALETIEASSFIVCLDDAAPVTLEERAHQYWHGDGSNRWFDKPCQFIVNDNGTSGFMGEHSMMDGTPTHRLNDTMLSNIMHNKLDLSNPTIRSDLPDPQPLKFAIDQQVTADIARASAYHSTTVAQHELRVQAYQGYGKGLIKKFKCSPDAYVQMIIQLAYHKMNGRSRPTYESAATRKFQQGRTETCRSVSDESVTFCDAMADPGVSGEECARLFREALKAHVQYITDASDGRGVDRHLFGLKKCLADGEEMPEVYKDPAYAYGSSWYVSSSQLSSEYFNGYGWSQVVDEGWGIAYMVNENR